MPNSCLRTVRRLVLGATLAGSLLVTARAGVAATITTIKPGVLQVCLYPGFKPFAWKDGKTWKGWDVDYLAAFAKENRLEFVPVEETSFDKIWLWPGQDKCDIAGTGISDTQDRRKATVPNGKWSATYYKVVRAFLVRSADKDKVKGVEDLRGKTVIVTLGSTADDDLVRQRRGAGDGRLGGGVAALQHGGGRQGPFRALCGAVLLRGAREEHGSPGGSQHLHSQESVQGHAQSPRRHLPESTLDGPVVGRAGRRSARLADSGRPR
jgi:hypothetical protein